MSIYGYVISLLIFTALSGWQIRDSAIAITYSCQTETDSITKQIVYTVVDIEPANEGGKSKLAREFEKITLSNKFPVDSLKYDSRVIVAFIVDSNGKVRDERLIRDKTKYVGAEMLKIIRSFNWSPGKCNGETVPVLVKQELVIDLAEK